MKISGRPISLFFLVLGVGVPLLFAEIILRLSFPPPPSITIENVVSDTDERAFTHDQFTKREDGTLEMEQFADWGLYIYTPTGTRLKKNVRAIIRSHAVAGKDIEIRTNNFGFRYDQLNSKTEQEKRVLVLGDSITLADNVSEEETYTRRTEQFLQKKSPDVKVVNAGVGAIDLENEFSIFMDAGVRSDPDIVVVGLYLNDAHASPKLQLTRVPYLVQWSYLARIGFRSFDMLRASYASSVVYDEAGLAQERKRSERVSEERFGQIIDGSIQDWGYAWSDGYWDKVLPLVDLFRDVTRERGMKLIFMLFPVRYQVEEFLAENQPQLRFKKEMELRKIPALDLLPLLQAHYAESQRTLFVDHCHYNTEGYRVVGEALGSFLFEKGDLGI